MAEREFWFPRRLANQLVLFANVFAKIDSYKTVLPLTTAQVTAIKDICTIFEEVYEYVEQIRASSGSLFEWRDAILKGQPKGDPAPSPSIFPPFGSTVVPRLGILQEFFEYRDLILASPGYNPGIGEDLMLLGSGKKEVDEGQITPELKVTTGVGYEVIVGGSLKGADALRVEYAHAGTEDWKLVAFFTKLPGEAVVTPTTPGQAEKGRVRGTLIRKNEAYGNPSPEYPVTLS
jgi:hypothetical protein